MHLPAPGLPGLVLMKSGGRERGKGGGSCSRRRLARGMVLGGERAAVGPRAPSRPCPIAA